MHLRNRRAMSSAQQSLNDALLSASAAWTDAMPYHWHLLRLSVPSKWLCSFANHIFWIVCGVHNVNVVDQLVIARMDAFSCVHKCQRIALVWTHTCIVSVSSWMVHYSQS